MSCLPYNVTFNYYYYLGETSDDEIEIENSQYEDPYQELLMENKKLKREIVSLNNALFKKDVEIRNEMADNYSIMIEQIETDWKYVEILILC